MKKRTREPTEVDLLVEEQQDDAWEVEASTVTRKRKNVSRPNKRAGEIFPKRRPKEDPWVPKRPASPLSAWMSDPSLLPKRPPGR